jgi:hypothetical protein
MATISKFYFHDAFSPNTGPQPPTSWPGQAPGDTLSFQDPAAPSVRDATDVIGFANPDVEGNITTNPVVTAQGAFFRRFVSRPLAAQTLPSGNWTFSYARTESNLNSNMVVKCAAYTWRPSAASVVNLPTAGTTCVGTSPTVAATQQAESVTGTMTGVSGSDVLDGDILVFDVTTVFTQSMSTAYTQQFAYDGTTEASATTCATFMAPPAAIMLDDPPVPPQIFNPIPFT